MFEQLKANLYFWYARNYIKHEVHYEFMLDLSNKEALTIRILKKYPGVVVEYANIHMSTDTDLAYDLSIIANPNLCNVESNKFKRFTTAVFRSILNDAVKNSKREKLNENRNSNFVEPNSERAVHEEITSLFEERVPERKPRKKVVRRNKKVHSEVQQPSSDSSP